MDEKNEFAADQSITESNVYLSFGVKMMQACSKIFCKL